MSLKRLIILGGIFISLTGVVALSSLKPNNKAVMVDSPVGENTMHGPPDLADSPPQIDTTLEPQYCVSRATDMEHSTEQTIATCFVTLDDAADYILADLALPTDSKDVILQAMEGDTSADSVIVGIDYSGSNYTGDRLYWYASAGCSGGKRWYAPTYPLGFNDWANSSLALSGCGTFRHFSLSFYQGSLIDCTCSFMDVMGNASSSAQMWE